MATPNETNSGPSGESATLLHTALFKQVSSEEAEELLPHLQHAEYNKGDYIFREGDTDHRMYLLERGRVKLIRQSSDRRVQLLSIHAYGIACVTTTSAFRNLCSWTYRDVWQKRC